MPADARRQARDQRHRDVDDGEAGRARLREVQRLVVEARVGREAAEHAGHQDQAQVGRERGLLQRQHHHHAGEERPQHVDPQGSKREVAKRSRHRRGEQVARAGSDRAAQADQ